MNTHRSFGQLSRLSLGVLIVLALATVGCGGGNDRVSTGAANDETPAPVNLTDGFATLSVPLTPRRQPLVVGGGHYAIVYGGFDVTGDASDFRQAPLGDGAVYDTAKDMWTTLADAPFDRPLYQAAGVWTDAEFVIIGTPCGETSADMEFARCKPGGLVAAAYSPEKETWRTLKAPNPYPHTGTAEGVPVTSAGLGWTGKDAVFRVDAAGPDQLALLDPSAGTWRWEDQLADTDTHCVTGDAVVAVSTATVTPEGAQTSPSPEAAAKPIRTFQLDTDTARWTELPITDKPASQGSLFERVYCSSGQLVYLPIKQPPVGLDTGGLWYEPDRGQWSQIPSFGSAGFAGTPIPAEVDGTRVLWLADGDELFVLPAGADEWARLKSPITGIVTLGALDDLLLVDPTWDQRPPTPLTIGLFDPTRYLAAQG